MKIDYLSSEDEDSLAEKLIAFRASMKQINTSTNFIQGVKQMIDAQIQVAVEAEIESRIYGRSWDDLKNDLKTISILGREGKA